MFYDSFLLAYRNLRERKFRSFLTLLGIAVGIAAIISLIAVSYGMQHTITKELVRMADTIVVMPGQIVPGRGYVELGAFTQRDVEDVERIGGIEEVGSWIVGVAEVEYRDERVPIELLGGNPSVMEKLYKGYAKIKEGRWLNERDYKGCAIGYSVAHEYFKDEIGLNDRITIGGKKFVVVGIFEKAGMMASADIDPHIFLTTRSARDVLGTDDISFIMVRVRDIDRVEEIAAEIEERIDKNHNLEGFTYAMTTSAMIEQIETVFLILQAVLVGIASIALIVGCIGIMNSMLMSVIERTHEIGIMKAIGATNSNIMFLFLTEAGMISLAGGIFGCVLGVAGANAISIGVSRYVGLAMPAIVTPEIIIGVLIVAILVGILSGLYPARRAAKMSPVEAFKYE